jgi:hypothetical protein
MINIDMVSNFEKESCTFDKGIMTFEKTNCPICFELAKGLLKHHQFASNFENRNFVNNGM